MLLFSSDTFQQNVLQESLDTIKRLCERPLEVASHARAIQADFRASGDRLLDPDQVKGTEVNTRTKLCSEQGDAGLPELMVIDEMTKFVKDTM